MALALKLKSLALALKLKSLASALKHKSLALNPKSLLTSLQVENLNSLEITGMSGHLSLTLEIPRGQIDPTRFFPVFSRTQWNFSGIINNSRGSNLLYFDGQIIVADQLFPKLWGKYKKPYERFHIFCYKKPLNIYFFTNLLIINLLFFTYLLSSIISS